MSEFLKPTLDLARSRGYLDFPETKAVLPRVPDWFHALGTDAGLAAFEARRGITVPAAVREFYRNVDLACFLEAALDGEVLLIQYAKNDDGELPPLADMANRQLLVVSFHCHSGTVLAVELDRDDPRTFAGFDGDDDPLEEPTETFSEMVYRCVDLHEARLDSWQAIYEKSKRDAAEARRIGGLEWVRDMPGMSARLGPA